MALIDLTNQRFERLLVLERAPKDPAKKSRTAKWKCRCDCGTELIVDGSNLRTGHTKSCGCLQKEKMSERIDDLSGKKFGLLTAISPKKISNQTYWLCKCDCGNEKYVYRGSLIRNLTTSCGCQKNISKEVLNITQLLNELNIPFKPEYKVNIENQSYYFDFFVNNKYFIEFDGEQHFKYKDCKGWNNKENTKKTHFRDRIKNKYCFDNNIPLIRIPYNKLYKKSDLILESSSFQITKENELLYYKEYPLIQEFLYNS